MAGRDRFGELQCGLWQADRTAAGYALIGRAVRHLLLERFDADLDELSVALAELTEQFEDEQLEPLPGEREGMLTSTAAMELAGKRSRTWQALDRLELLYGDLLVLCVATVPDERSR